MEKIKSKLPVILIILFIMTAIFIISDSYIMAPDEYNYSHIAWTDIKIEGIKDIITSQISMYKNWTGRVPVHTCIQFLLYVGTWLYKIINPIIFVIFILLLGKIINKEQNYYKVILPIFLLLFTIKDVGEKFIWLSGSINYLWTGTIVTLMIYYYYKILEKQENINKKTIPIFLLLSFLSGWSQENMAFVLGSFIITIFLLNIKKIKNSDKKTKITIFLSIILFGIGAMLLLFAPGNFIRFNTTEKTFHLDNIITNLKGIKYLIIIYIISLIGALLKNNKQGIKEVIRKQLIFLIPVAIGLTPMIIISEFYPRAMLAYEIMLIIITINNTETTIKNLNLKKLVIAFNMILTILVGYNLITNIAISQNYMKPYKEKMQTQIQIAQSKGEKKVILSRFDYASKINNSRRNILLNFAPTSFKENIINTYMATYYGFDTVEAIGENEYLIKIQLSENIENKSFDLVNMQNEKVRDSLVYEPNTTINEIEFIILKEELENVKIDLPNEIKDKITKIECASVLNIEDIDLYKVVK